MAYTKPNVQKFKYFAYHDGYDPSLLRIGNLALDYANPQDHQPYHHKDPIDLFGNPAWATKDTRSKCVITHENGNVRGFAVGSLNLLDLDLSNSKNALQSICGETGSMIELKEPHNFFENVILKSEAAQKWLQVRLTVADDFSTRVKTTLNPTLSIWLLTGVYLMENTSQQRVISSSSTRQTTFHLPVPDPSGVAAPLQVNIGGSASIESNRSVVTSGVVKEEKVWAAQWQKVKGRKVTVKKWEDALQNQIRLLETFSLGVVRGTKAVPKNEVVQLELHIGEQEIDESSEALDEDDWAEFDEEVEELIANMENQEEE